MKYDFNAVVNRETLSTMKWEVMFDVTNNPNLLCFGTAEMDLKAAQPIIDAFQRVVDAGHFGYPYKRQSYYDAFTGWFKRHCNFEIKKEWMANSVAIYPSFQSIIEGLSEEGDEVIYHTPVHFIFEDIVTSLNRKAVENPLTIKDDKYVMDFEDLKKKITPKTRLFILCNPHNPVGRAWTKEELTKLMDICMENNIIVISDDVYFGLAYPGKNYIPLASISKEASMNSITCISPSKSFNLTGIKHSVVFSENEIILNKYKDELHKNNEFFGESIFGHAAIEAAFGECDDWSEQLMEHIQENYNIVKDFINENLPSVKIYKPDATYFLWMDFSCLNMSRDEMAVFFEKKSEVAISLGYTLGTGGENFIRLNMACPKSILIDGLNRIKKAYHNL